MATDGSVLIDTKLDYSGIDKQVSKIKSNLTTGFKAVAKAGTVALGGITAAIGGVATASVKISETTDRVDKMSQRLGLSRDAFQEWDFVLSQSGSSIDSMQMGMKTLTQKMEDSTTEGSAAADTFKKLGVNVQDANGNFKDQEVVFDEVIKSLQGMEDGIEKAAIAQEIFGRNGQELLPLINADAEAIEEMKQQAHDLGLVLSDETIDAGVSLTDTMDQMKRASTSLITSGLTPMLQPINDLLQGFIGLTTGVAGAKEQMQTALQDLVDNSISLLTDMLPDVLEFGAMLVKSIVVGVAKALPDLWGKIKYGLGYAIGTMIRLLPEFLEQGKSVVSNIISGISATLGDLATKIGEVIATIVDYIANNSGLIVEKGKDILKWIYEGAFNAIEWALNIGIDIINNILEGLGVDTGRFAEKAKEVVGYFIGSLKSFYNTLIDIGGFIIEKLLYGLTHPGELLDAGVAAVKAYINGLKSMISDIYNVGENIVSGLINGVKDGFSKITDVAKDIGSTLLSGVKNALGIHSPSKEMAELGGYTTDGFKQGIEDGMSGVEQTAEELAEIVPGAVNDNLESVTEAGKATGEALKDGVNTGLEGMTDELDERLADAKADLKDWTDDIETGINSIVSGFGDIGEELANGEFGWSSLGNVALQTLADILNGLAAQLTALAAVKVATFDWGGAALAAAGAGAASLAAGYLGAKASASTTTSTSSTTASTTSSSVSSSSSSSSSGNLDLNVTVAVDGDAIANATFENIDVSAALAN